MRTFFHLFRLGTQSGWRMYKVELTPAVVFGARIPRALLQPIFFIMIAQAAGGSELARFALVGNAVHIAIATSLIFMAIVIDQVKWNDLLPYLVASPANWFPLLMGQSVPYFAEALCESAIVFGAMLPLFGPDIELVNLLRAAPLIMLAAVSTSALGWLIGAVTLPVRWGWTLTNNLAYLFIILCGVNFPVSALPDVLARISQVLPLTNALLAIRAVIDGASYGAIATLLAAELLIGLGYSVAAWLVFNHRLRILRQRGALEMI